jgi:hypothetical protein
MEAKVKNIDFTGQNIYGGFDVPKKSSRVTVMAENFIDKTFTQPAGHAVLNYYLERNFPGD